MEKASGPAAHRAPPLRAVPFLKPLPAAGMFVLTDRQREQLARIGTRMRLSARTVIYREESPAQWVFAIVDGAVKSYRELPSGKRIVSAFLFAISSAWPRTAAT
jgi:CRP-like cAMP-binding protein